MIFTLILMPLVVLGILLLSGNIVNLSTHLYVEYIEFVEDDIVLNKDSDADVLSSVSVNIYPLLATNKAVEFWSGDDSIVSISEDGTIVGKDFGRTYIYAKSKENETKQASCRVTVTSDRVHRLWINNTISTMYVGNSHLLDVKYAPNEALDTSLDFVSSDSSILSIAIDGEMVARSAGKVRVTAYLRSNHNISTSMEILVKEPVQGIWINNSSPEVSGNGKFTFPGINFVPEGASEEVTYTSSDTSIATVDTLGNITFIRSGSVDITASIVGGKSVTKKYTSTLGYFTGITFDQSNIKNIRYEDYINTPISFILNPTPSDGDISNITLSSSDEKVLRISDGKGYVTGGGRVTVRATAKTDADSTIYAEWTITVSRDVQSIAFGVNDFSYTSSREVSLNISYLPLDASESIKYRLSDNQIATIDNGKLKFSSSAISNGYGKVEVIAYTDSGAEKSVVITYIDATLDKKDVSSENSIALNLPKSGEKAYRFALVDSTDGLKDIDMNILSGENNITLNGHIVTLVNRGNATIGIKYNDKGNYDKIITLDISRLIEDIVDISVEATWQDRDSVSFDASNSIYSSSDRYNISYTLYPSDTTRNSVDISIISGEAEVSGSSVIFSTAGEVVVRLSADGITKDITIHSTYLHPDNNTSVDSIINLNAGDSVSLFDYIDINPIGADKGYFSFESDDDCISLDGDNLSAICGGSADIVVAFITPSGRESRIIRVNITEMATSIVAVKSEYIYEDKSIISIVDKFTILPVTANAGKAVAYEIVEGKDIASLNAKNEVVFASSGRVTVMATLANGDTATISLVYTGNIIKVISLDTDTHEIYIDKGEKYIFDYKYTADIISIASVGEAISLDLSGVFEGLYGSETEISLSDNNVIKCYVLEDVEEIRFAQNTVADEYITALGSRADNKAINLSELYGAYYYPTTARNREGAYVLSYLASSSIASIEGDKLAFDSIGKVTITVTAGGKSASRVVESTLGYAKSVEFKDSSELVFDYDNYSTYSLLDTYTVYPSDAYKANISISSSNEDVIKIENSKIVLVGGGSAKVKLAYSIDGEKIKEISKDIYVISRVKGIDFYDNNIKTGYMVKNLDSGNAFNLDFRLVSEVALSQCKYTFESSNENIATVSDSGRVTILGNGEFSITIRVADKLNNSGVYDCVSSIRILNDASYNITNIYSETNEVIFDWDNRENNILYTLVGSNVDNYRYSVISGEDVLSVNSFGKIIISQGGDATIAITNGEWSKNISVFVNRPANVTLDEDNIVTALKGWNIKYTLSAEDTLIRKSVTFASSDENIASVSMGKATFKKAGLVNITISIMYGDVVESSVTFHIRSTFGNVESFSVDKTTSTICVGESDTFTISNIYPVDYSGELAIVSTDTTAYTVTTSNNSFTIVGVKGGTSVLTIKFASTDSVYITANIEVIQLSESIDIQYNNKTVTSLKAFDAEVTLSAVVLPYDTKNKDVEWKIENIDGKATINNGKITFTSYGSVKVTVEALDGVAKNSIIVEYVRDIDDFRLSYIKDGQNIDILDNDIVYVDWNVNSIILTINIEPSTLTDFDNYTAFTGSGNVVESKDVVVVDNKITINITDFKSSMTFDDTITINYRGKIDKAFRLIRDGVQSIDLVDHDNTLDTQYGLQQMRLFGNRSYYDGAIQNYYRMNVNIYNSNVVTNSLYNSIKWTSSNSNVNISSNSGYVDIYFNTIAGSTINEIYNDDFTSGEVTITATSLSGEKVASYTFHIVDAVNVFDEAGYLGGGYEIVLHDNLVPTTFSVKNTIYGNGKTLNLLVKNSKDDETYKETKEYSAVYMQNIINLNIVGANNATDERLVHIGLSSCSAYSDLKYLYRICVSDYEVKIKKTIFTSFSHSGIFYKTSTGILYLEDLIMFDVGARAIEIQKVDDKAGDIYVKGFLDVYNFQNKKALETALDITLIGGNVAKEILSLAEEKELTVEKNGEKWANMVGISGKGTDLKMYYYNYSTGEYEYKEDGDHDSARGLTRFTESMYLGAVKVTAWAYKNDHSIKWENEYNEDGSLNMDYLISTSVKATRLYGTM